VYEAWKGLVWQESKSRRRPGVEAEDLAQEGYFGLMEAVKKFDPHRDVRFATVAYWWIRQRVSAYLKGRGAPLPQGEVPDEPLAVEGDDDTAGAKAVPNEALVAAVGEELAWLSPTERRAIRLRFGLDGGAERTTEEVAEALGVGPVEASTLVRRGLNRLRQVMGQMPPARQNEQAGLQAA
jgi:RNA polymerase sporulation-specific sigma factor